METKHSVINLNRFRLHGMLLFFLCLGLQSYAQSFYYFENSYTTGDNTSLTFYTFLMVDPDGTGTARVRYKDPGTDDDRLLELHLKDSTIAGREKNDSLKYLIPFETNLIAGVSDLGFLPPHFVFKKRIDGTETYYFPVGVELFNSIGNQLSVKMMQNQEKTLEGLRKDKRFVEVFYNEDDPLYSFLTEQNKTRNIVEKRKEKLFLIAVAHTIDPKIGVSSKKDLEKVTKTFTALAKEIGIQNMVITKIEGDNFSKKAVEDALKNLKPSPIDIVIFYYSGHGFRYQNDSKSKYPRMSMRKNKELKLEQNNLSVEAVYEKIVSKGAKVNIVLSDCCNEDIGAEPRIGNTVLKTKGGLQPAFNIENAKKLFLPAKPLSIISASADTTQLASGNPELGGFFTHFFITELEKNIYTKINIPPNWLRIFVDAKEKARYQALTALCKGKRCVQTAIFELKSPR